MVNVQEQKITLRVRPETHEKLKLLASHRSATMNRIIREALDEYLSYQLADLERDLTRTLAIVRRYASSDENVDVDLRGFVAAELSQVDPMKEVLLPVGQSKLRAKQKPISELEKKVGAIIG